MSSARALIEDLSSCALFLDLDGTVLEIASAPHLVRVPVDLPPLLARLAAALNGAVAIVTGRQIAEVDRFLAPFQLATAGVHGAQLRLSINGDVLSTVGPLDPSVAFAVARLADLAPGIVIESKLHSVAVHYRLAPSAEPDVEAALREIVAGSPDHFILCPGRCVIEVLPRHISKGAALEALLALPNFKGRRPIMIGDDVPDESALASAERHGGLGLRVAGEHFSSETADFQGPAQVLAWIATAADKLESV